LYAFSRAASAGFITKRLSKSIWSLLLSINKRMGRRKVLEIGRDIGFYFD
jgi:hypothetical protein